MKRYVAFFLALCMLLSMTLAEEISTPTDLTCAHENTYDIGEVVAENLRIVDDIHHMFDEYEIIHRTCEDCGEYFIADEVFIRQDVLAPHSLDLETGECLLWCGYKTECTHSNVESLESSSYSNFEPLNDKSHTADVIPERVDRCADCGAERRIEIGEMEKIEIPHSFVSDWEDTYCTACGYESTCAHSNTAKTEEEISWWGTGKPIDEKQHEFDYSIYTMETCADCGADRILDDGPEPEILHKIENHAYEWVSGWCYICDTKNKCMHPNQESETIYFNYQGFKPVDEKNHTVTVTVNKLLTCPDCVATKVEETLEGQTITEEHKIENGVCTLCQYAMPTATPAPTETAAPTEAPTEAPTTMPTAAPAETAAPTEAPTEAPTTMPTAAPTPAPTRRPATPPAAEPEEETTEAPVEVPAESIVKKDENIPTLVEAVSVVVKVLDDEDSVPVTIDIVGAENVMTEEEHAQMTALPVQEQLLVVLASMGFGDVVLDAVQTSETAVSKEAAALMETVTKRFETATEEEKADLAAKLAETFPTADVMVDGIMVTYYVIEMQIDVNGETSSVFYGFRMTDDGQWELVKL